MALRADDQRLLDLRAHDPQHPAVELRLVEGGGQSEAVLEAQTLGLFLGALGQTVGAAVSRPRGVARSARSFTAGLAGATAAAVRRAVGQDVDGPIAPPRDRRFADATWDENAAFWWLRQVQLLNERFIDELIEHAPLTEPVRRKASFLAEVALGAASPTNLTPTNPAAIKRAFETGGLSVVRGAKAMAHDVRHNHGWPSAVDTTPFEVGTTLAATEGRVVYRSHLIEVIQYDARTEQVHEVPLLFCPPWINRFYIMDLAPGRSLIEWAIDHGHTCFAISYRNADASLRDASFEEYIEEGPRRAVSVVKEITGAERVNTVGVCLGGTLNAMAMAVDASKGDDDVNSATFINTHTDFTRPGTLGAFTDEATVDLITRYLDSAPLLSSRHMGHTFALLRANDLVFQYVVSGWLLGKEPAAFDLLAWNEDGTNMPARLHSDFLRSCYVENRFANGEMEVGGTTLDPSAVTTPSYVVSAVDDHIVPWASAYQSTQVLNSDDQRFVLSSGGHIAAIVNPPSPKARFWANDELPADHDEWLARAVQHDGTWWEDWAAWLADRSGPMVAAPTELGAADHLPMDAAPGTYVLT